MKKKLLFLLVVLIFCLVFSTAAFAEPAAAPVLLGATTDETGGVVTLTFDKAMADPSADAASFTVYATGYSGGSAAGTDAYAIGSVSLNMDATMIDINLNDPVLRGDIVSVSYTPGTVVAVDTGVLEAFTGESVDNIIPVEVVSNMEGTWEAYDHVGYWGENAFPNGDNDYRGSIYNRHIVINGAEVTFYGYGSPAFKDFLFLPSDDTAAKGFDFTMNTSQIDFHAMEGGGFLFNAQIVGGVLSGYCMLIQGTYGSSTNFVGLYEITGINVNSLRNEPYYGLASISGITLLNTYPLADAASRNIRLETSSDSVSMWDGATQVINNYQLANEYGNGIGIIGSHISHSCSSLSIFKFSDLELNNIADLTATLNGTKANLSFSDISDADDVTVEQSTDGINFVPATLSGAIDVNDTTATVTGLDKYTTYYFRLAITGGIYNGHSRVATAEYIPVPISDLEAKAGDKKVTLTFTAPYGATAVTVQQSTDGESFVDSTTKAAVTADSTSAVVTGLTNGQEYYFRLVVADGAFEGTSNVDTATPKASETGGGGGASVANGVAAPVDTTGTSNTLSFVLGSSNSFIKYGASGVIVKPMDVKPLVRDNRTFLPIRYVIDAIGGTIFWDADIQQVTIIRGDTEIKLWIGKNTATVNGVFKMIDPDNPDVVPLIEAPGRVFLPLRFISEALGCTVNWDSVKQTITITNW